MQLAKDKDGTTDTALMLAYRAGNTSAFDELYHRHRAPLYRYVLNSCDGEAIAAELFQDIWTRVIDARHGYTESAPFQAWLYRIARNRLIDFYRANNKHSDTKELTENIEPQITQLQTPLQPDEIAELAARKDVLETALTALPSDQREVVLLRHIAGFGVQEIALLIDENAETVKSRLRYAFTKLRKHMRTLI